jgi:hypothetical protein
MSGTSDRSEIRIVLTIGLLAAFVVHALTLTTAQRAAPYVEAALFTERVETAPPGGINFDQVQNAGPAHSLPVNAAARDELKKQAPVCIPCQQVNGTTPQLQPSQPAGVNPKPVTARYSISVFVLHNDPESQRMLQWWNTNETLQKWRRATNFHVYTRDNELYKGRFASKIPPTAFPAVMVTDPSGGHVYLCDRTCLPKSEASLVQEVADATALQKQVVQQSALQPEPPVAPFLYQAAAALGNATRPPDCPDGNCEPDNRLFPINLGDGGFLDRVRKPDQLEGVEGLIRSILRPGETLLTMGLVLVAVFLLVYFIKRRG